MDIAEYSGAVSEAIMKFIGEGVGEIVKNSKSNKVHVENN